MQVAYGDEILHKEVERDSGEAFLLKASRKASCWTYEEEFRVYKTPTNHRADDAQGNHPFDSAIVDGIFLGLRLPDEHREQVIAVAKTARHEISIFQAQMHPDQLKIIFAAVDLA